MERLPATLITYFFSKKVDFFLGDVFFFRQLDPDKTNIDKNIIFLTLYIYDPFFLCRIRMHTIDTNLVPNIDIESVENLEQEVPTDLLTSLDNRLKKNVDNTLI